MAARGSHEHIQCHRWPRASMAMALRAATGQLKNGWRGVLRHPLRTAAKGSSLRQSLFMNLDTGEISLYSLQFNP